MGAMKTHEHPKTIATGTSRRRFRKVQRSDVLVQERDHFGKLLREERIAQGMTVPELASVCGLTKDYLYKIERGDAAPPASERIIQISKAMGVNPDRVLSHANRISPDVEDAIMSKPDIICGIIRTIAPHGESGLKYLSKIIDTAVSDLKKTRLQQLQDLSDYQSVH